MPESNEDKSIKMQSSHKDLDKMISDIMPDVLKNQSLPNSDCCKQQRCYKCQNCCRPNCTHKSCECAYIEILESIARVENSLACILNMEGEKLQKAICKANCIDELLAVNCSVRDTIIQTTYLEQVLYSKLELVLEQCKSSQQVKGNH